MLEIHYGRKRSGIKRELKKKVDEWLESIESENVRKIAKNNVIVTGGAIASMLLGERINDFDIYFKTKKATLEVASYYVNKFMEINSDKVKKMTIKYEPEVRQATIENCKGIEEERVIIWMKSAGVIAEEQEDYNYFETLSENQVVDFAETLIESVKEEKPRYRPVFMSQNAITLSDKIQIVIRFFGNPKKIHNNYDFVHATCYWDHAKNFLYLDPDAMECLLSRVLIYRGSLYPVASIFRMKKFVERGWRITAGQQLKIMWQISELDLKNPMTLREQLTGVDMAYMYQLISALEGIEPEKIDSSYIATIIDRIFE